MKWNKIISAFLLPLLIYSFAETGHVCVSMLAAHVNPATSCCCSTHEDAVSSSQQQSCCDKESPNCGCTMHNTDMPFQSTVIDTHLAGVTASANVPYTRDIHIISQLPKWGVIILSEPVHCFAVTHWRKIRLTC